MREDARTGVPQVISVTEHQIHTGNTYVVTQKYAAVAAGASVYLELKTPNTATIVNLKEISAFSTKATGAVSLIEAPTVTTGATAVTPVNLNRQSANTAASVVKSNPTGISGGTTLETIPIYNYATPRQELADKEYDLAKNTTYLVKLTNNDAAEADMIVRIIFYSENNELPVAVLST